MTASDLTRDDYRRLQELYESLRRHRLNHPRDFVELLRDFRSVADDFSVDPMPYERMALNSPERVSFNLAVRLIDPPSHRGWGEW